MVDYKEMYLTLFRATERAIRELEAGQRACEEMYMESDDSPNLVVLEQDAEKIDRNADRLP